MGLSLQNSSSEKEKRAYLESLAKLQQAVAALRAEYSALHALISRASDVKTLGNQTTLSSLSDAIDNVSSVVTRTTFKLTR